MKALQIVGSPTSTFFYDLSLLYARDIIAPNNYELCYAVAYPDGNWQVKKDLDASTTALSMVEMIEKIQDYDIAIPHLFCDAGLTHIRILFNNVLKIPLVGSSGYTARVAQDKHLTKTILQANGVTVPKGKLVYEHEIDKIDLLSLELPCIIKPNNADNSDGVTLVKNADTLNAAVKKALEYSSEVLIEQYIPGRELRGALLEINGAFTILPFIEYKVSDDFPIRLAADKLKFDKDGTLLNQSDKKQVPAQCPAILDEKLLSKLKQQMIKSHNVLGCRNFSMFDFRIDKNTHEPYLLETGLFWSFSEKSMISKMIKAAGLDLKVITKKIWDDVLKNA